MHVHEKAAPGAVVLLNMDLAAYEHVHTLPYLS